MQGVFALVLVGIIFTLALKQGLPEDEVRALTFFSLVMTIVGLIFVNRTFSASIFTALTRPNSALGWVLIAVTLVAAMTLLLPFASTLFRFGPLHLHDLALTLGAGVIVLVVLELLKHLWSTRLRNYS